MTDPIVTELPQALEPTTRDPFLDGEPVTRELDRRRNDGIEVRLLWDATSGVVSIAVRDDRTGDAFAFEVDGRDATEAFHHPYAHAAHLGIAWSQEPV